MGTIYISGVQYKFSAIWKIYVQINEESFHLDLVYLATKLIIQSPETSRKYLGFFFKQGGKGKAQTCEHFTYAAPSNWISKAVELVFYFWSIYLNLMENIGI